MALTGKQFKAQHPGPYYKFLRANLTHYGFTYQIGLNIDAESFNPTGQCKKGGFYFFSDLKYADEFYSYGPRLVVVEIPDDALVYVEIGKFKADKFVLSVITESEDRIIELFKRAVNNGVRPSKRVCRYAADYGHLEVLKWARKNNCSWDERTCSNAACNGHLVLLKWAIENGCPANKLALIHAAVTYCSTVDEQVREWLYQYLQRLEQSDSK